jgi:maleate isomerase
MPAPFDVAVMVSPGKICCNIGGKARHVVSWISREAGDAVSWQPSTRADIYGSRARIGYTCPPLCAEVFPYEFYKLVPAGVTLVITTLTVIERSASEVEQAYEMSMRAARELAAAGVDVVFLGGVPVNLARGSQNAEQMLAALTAELGVKVSSSAAAQEKAAKLLGCRKVVVAHPYGAREDARLIADAERYGCEVRGVLGWGKTITEFGRIPATAALEMGRALMRAHPDADSIFFPSPHWPVIEAIAPLEREFGVTVMAAGQACIWDALRLARVDDRIDGYGRLLREF